ncbi:MAG: hypothetical protein A2Y20_01255 [Firmicutes bacterium GWF2_51_9]|nr:MAG: hypothetical protein A2Y20_01255 [Firmicutes bacterium GWF2_51_9]OGS58361.1 MAG: hypothetical protein A2Y19_08610 [Firmicutes bacterium GWE2_51_13]HAM64160.1 hypothetical protein [Erysipelotrichaceae bacterium]HBZ40783.1 hypothetical protein [Erysipelotrichaceae bacterium]
MNKNNSFIKNVIGFSIPTWISFVISFLSTPIITRLFVPAEMGRINLFSTILNLLMLITFLGFDQAFVRFYKELPGKYTKNEFFTFALSSSLIFGILVSTVVLVMSDFFSLQISGTENFLISACLSVSVITNIILKYLNVYSRMERNIVLYSIQTISITIVGKIFFVIVALWNPSHENAIIALTLGYLVLSVVFSLVKKEAFAKITYFDKSSAISLAKFGIPLIPVTVLAWMNNSIPQFMLKEFVDYSAIGIYTNAVAIANTMNLIQTGFSIYWIPYVYANYRDNPKQIQKIHRYVTFLMCTAGIFLIFSQNVIYLLLGEAYRSSKIFFPFLLLSPIAFTIAETTGIGIGISKRSYLNIFSFSASTFTNISVSLYLIPRIGIHGAAISSGVAALVLLLVKTFIGEKYYVTITNYFQTLGSISTIVAATIVNYFIFSNSLLKYSLIIGLALLLVLINKDIVSELFNIIKPHYTSRRKRL